MIELKTFKYKSKYNLSYNQKRNKKTPKTTQQWRLLNTHDTLNTRLLKRCHFHCAKFTFIMY